MKTIHRYTSHFKDSQPRYWLSIEEAPAWKVLRGRAYHWWDMRSFKWRLMKRVVGPLSEMIHPQHFHLPGKSHLRHAVTDEMEAVEGEPFNMKIPWDVRQDLRCHDWNSHRELFSVEITKEQFESLDKTRAD